MEEAMQALVFFWFAGLACMIGLMLAFFAKADNVRKVGAVFMVLGFLSLLATPWTLTFSPSSAFGHLLGSILGPCVLMGVGFYQITFSGHVPVGRLSPGERKTGFAMVIVGFVWLEAMHWWILTPTYPNEVNRYWLVFWPTFLLFGVACSCTTYALVGHVGNKRNQEQRLMMLIAVFLGFLLVLGILVDGPNVLSESFASALFLAGADLFGLLTGAALAIVLFALVIAVYESQQPSPLQLNSPSKGQLQQAAEMISANLTGGEEE